MNTQKKRILSVSQILLLLLFVPIESLYMMKTNTNEKKIKNSVENHFDSYVLRGLNHISASYFICLDLNKSSNNKHIIFKTKKKNNFQCYAHLFVALINFNWDFGGCFFFFYFKLLQLASGIEIKKKSKPSRSKYSQNKKYM